MKPSLVRGRKLVGDESWTVNNEILMSHWLATRRWYSNAATFKTVRFNVLLFLPAGPSLKSISYLAHGSRDSVKFIDSCRWGNKIGETRVGKLMWWIHLVFFTKAHGRFYKGLYSTIIMYSNVNGFVKS